jgi:hypothetical protein
MPGSLDWKQAGRSNYPCQTRGAVCAPAMPCGSMSSRIFPAGGHCFYSRITPLDYGSIADQMQRVKSQHWVKNPTA